MYGSLYVFAPAGRKHPCSSLVCKTVQKFPGKVSEIRETVEFPKCEPLNRNFWKFSRAKLQGKKTSWKFFENLGIPREVVLFYGNF